MTVKRYRESEYMDEHPEGDWVSFADYADAHRAMAALLAALADDPVGLDAQVFSEATCEAMLECKAVLDRGGADPVEDDR